MSFTFSQSQSLFERAEKVFADGVNSSIRKLEKPGLLYFLQGAGYCLWDEAPSLSENSPSYLFSRPMRRLERLSLDF